MAFLNGLSSGWIILLVVAAYFIGAMYIYAPFKIRRQQIKEVKVDYRPTELPELPPEVAQASSRHRATCQRAGFTRWDI